MYFMRKLLCFFILVFFAGTVYAKDTACTEYLKNIYKNQYEKEVKLVSKKEHIDKYEQKIGDKFISSIAYGTGYLKIKGQKKIKINYICLLENCDKPFWGYIIPR